MMLIRDGQPADICAEDWSYCGNCPLPTCNPGPCQDGAPLRDYIYCRLNLIAPNFAQTWQGGDVLFLGDSNTDVATAYNMFPILPRGFNAAVLGSRICDVNACVSVVQSWLDSLTSAHSNATYAPSALVIMVGTNDLLRDINGIDNHFTPATAQQYVLLFDQLGAFRQANGQCNVVVRSVLPGIPAASGCCTDGYQPDAAAYKQAVLDANAFLAPLCQQHGFFFLDDYDHFWNYQEDTIQDQLYRNGSFYNPCTKEYFADQIHLGCPGQRVALMDVAAVVYQALPAPQGPIASITAPPYAAPLKSTYELDPSMMYRFVQLALDPDAQISLSAYASSYNYVGLFQPGQVGGYPVAEMLDTNNNPAQTSFTNQSGETRTLVACFGTNPDMPGDYQVGTTA